MKYIFLLSNGLGINITWNNLLNMSSHYDINENADNFQFYQMQGS